MNKFNIILYFIFFISFYTFTIFIFNVYKKSILINYKKIQNIDMFDNINNNDKYLFVLPYGGLSNQLISLFNSVSLAKKLDRKLILSPLTISKHESPSNKYTPLWNYYYNIDNFSNKINLSITEIKPKYNSHISCHVIYEKHEIGYTTQNFIKEFNLTIKYLEYNLNNKNITDYFLYNEENVICITDIFHVKIENDENIWNKYAKHLHFNHNIINFSENIIKKFTSKHYIGVHIRRDDIIDKCKVNIYERCVMSIKQISQKINKYNKLPVLIATDEKRNTELNKMKEQGWIILNHTYFKTNQKFGPFGSAVVDSYILSKSNIFIGEKISTFSKLTQWRVNGWYNNYSLN